MSALESRTLAAVSLGPVPTDAEREESRSYMRVEREPCEYCGAAHNPNAACFGGSARDDFDLDMQLDQELGK